MLQRNTLFSLPGAKTWIRLKKPSAVSQYWFGIWLSASVLPAASVRPNFPCGRRLPIINAIEVCRLAGLSGWLVLSVLVPFANLFVPLYVALKLSQRFGTSDVFGVALGLTGFLLLPWLGFGPREIQSPSVSVDSRAEPTSSEATAPIMPLVAVIQRDEETDEQLRRRESRTRMIVLSAAYGCGLLSLPGLLIVGMMAFGGATQDQVARAGAVAITTFAIPISLLVAMVGGWILHSRKKYTVATTLVLLPIANVVALVGSLVWVFAV